jgi:hypothetical protein
MFRKTDERVELALELLATKLLAAESEIANLKTQLAEVTAKPAFVPDLTAHTGQYL